MNEQKKYPVVFISILNWMNCEDTIECVQSLDSLNYPNYRIIVRDNGSMNDSFNLLKLKLPAQQIFKSETNNGYASGHFENYLLAKELKADLFWILNSDLQVHPESLNALVDAYQKHGNHIYGSVSLNPEQQELIDFGGAPYTEKSTTQLHYNSWKGRPLKELQTQQPELYEVESVEGSSMLIPMALIEKYGFMKLNFFMYGEETDYCYRLRKQGVMSLVVTHSLVTHHNEGSTKLSPTLKVIPAYYRRRNALRYSREHLGMSSWEALGYKNGTFQNLKTLVKGMLSKTKDLNYYYALGCLHAYLGKKGKVVQPEKFL